MILPTLLAIAMLIFPVSEVALAVRKRAKRVEADVHDRGSLRLLWLSIGVGVALAIAAAGQHIAPLPLPVAAQQLVALCCLAAGMALRWTSILTLGRYFTVDVATQANQPVIQHGPYRFVRHPSYSGLLLAFVGLGVTYGTWPSLLLLLAPILPALMVRISREEAVLRRVLGTPYDEYCARTKRLIPGVF